MGDSSLLSLTVPGEAHTRYKLPHIVDSFPAFGTMEKMVNYQQHCRVSAPPAVVPVVSWLVLSTGCLPVSKWKLDHPPKQTNCNESDETYVRTYPEKGKRSPDIRYFANTVADTGSPRAHTHR